MSCKPLRKFRDSVSASRLKRKRIISSFFIFHFSLSMDAQLAVDICRDSIWIALKIGAPVLIAGTAIGLLIGLFQALTQIQEQTIATVLKILVMVLAIAYLMPWMADHLIEFTTDIFKSIPEKLTF